MTLPLILWASLVWLAALMHMVWVHRSGDRYVRNLDEIYRQHEIRREEIHRKLIADLRASYGLPAEPTPEERVH